MIWKRSIKGLNSLSCNYVAPYQSNQCNFSNSQNFWHCFLSSISFKVSSIFHELQNSSIISDILQILGEASHYRKRFCQFSNKMRSLMQRNIKRNPDSEIQSDLPHRYQIIKRFGNIGIIKPCLYKLNQ